MSKTKDVFLYNDYLNFLKNKRSIRIYNNKKVSQDDILKIINAGIQAPSPTNTQGWKFKIIDDQNEIYDLTLIIKNEIDEYLIKLDDGFLKQSFKEYSKNFTFLKNSPCVILLYSIKPRKILRNFFKSKLNFYKGEGSLLSLGMVMQNMMLSAYTLGISSCPLTGPLIAEKKITTKYPPPKKYELSGLITFGFTNNFPINPGRKPMEKFII
ncbi:MAG: nitroreductase family protein [Spirochaetes bacterium]|nr:nitroreductase family protein [Spirochaetota bacterium]